MDKAFKRRKAAGHCRRCSSPPSPGYATCDKHRHMDLHSKRLREYGIGNEEAAGMLAAQGGRCASCSSAHPGGSRQKRSWAVDHDHSTGKVRGVLCYSSNMGIGLLFDSPEILRSALRYLERASPEQNHLPLGGGRGLTPSASAPSRRAS